MGPDVQWWRVTQAPHTFQKKQTQLVMDPLCNHLHPEAHRTWWVVKVNRMSMASKCPAAPYKIVSVEICICPKDDIDCGRGAFAATKAGCWTTADCWNLCRERERRGKKKNVYRAPWYTYLFYFLCQKLHIGYEKDPGLAKRMCSEPVDHYYYCYYYCYYYICVCYVYL